MSVQALSCAFATRGLTASEKLVLLALANYADDKMRCWPSQEKIAADTELSDRTVWGALKAMERRKIISREARKRSDGTRSTDVITLHFAGVVETDPLADFAKPTRNICEDHSQPLRNPLAPVATLTTFEPSIEEPKKENRRGSRLAEDWSPTLADAAYAKANGLSVAETVREEERFRNYWRSVAGAKGVKLDWSATWRNWILNVVERRAQGPPKAKRQGFV